MTKVAARAEALKIRVRTMREFGIDVPPSLDALMRYACDNTLRPGSLLSFAVSALAPTVNHMHMTVPGGRRILTPEVHAFRATVMAAMGNKRHMWRPQGVVMPIVVMESPYWITKKLEVRDSDSDNRLKALFDAIELATGIRDSRNWEIHAYKLVSSKVRTSVYLFDLGDIVDRYA